MGVYFWIEYQTHYQPTANTVVYYPLSLNADDYSGNNYHLTENWSITYTEQWAVFTWSQSLSRSTTALLPTWASDRTVSMWMYPQSSSGYKNLIVYWSNASLQSFRLWVSKTWYLVFSSYGSDSSTYATPFNNRYNVVAKYTNNTVYVYVNNTLWITFAKTLNTTNSNLNIWMNIWGSNNMIWKISEVIIENKARTDTEISNYYNSTKSLYWL